MDISPKEVKVALSGRITFEQDVSVALGAKVISMLQSPAEDTGPPGLPEPPSLPALPAPEDSEAPSEAPTPPEGHQGQADESPRQPQRRHTEGPRQALELSGANTIPERMTAFAAYLLHEEGHESFTQPDVRRLFQRARERIPTHFTREFDRAVQAGWIHEAETKGEFYLSQAAQNVLEDGFKELRLKRGRKQDNTGPKRGVARKRQRAIATPDAFSSFDHIPTTLEGVIPYHQIKLKRDKLLWALMLAKHLGVTSLQNLEAEWLTDKLGDGISNRDMNGHYTGLHRSGFVNRSLTDNAMRITEQGEEYLRSL